MPAQAAHEPLRRFRVRAGSSRSVDAVVTETLRHDGDPRLARHVADAHARDTRYGRVIVKDTKDSPHKIDLAVAAVIAHERAIFHADHPVAEPEILVAFG